MGHEAAGVIARLGGNVADWAEGDRVTFDSTINCGKCWFCRRGQINLCDRREIFGVSCDECRREGAFAEYVAVPQHILYRLPDSLSFRHAAMVEPVAVAVHAVNRTRVRLGDTAVVVGAGVIGLLLVQALRAAGCGRIIAVDLDPKKLDLACKLGADEALRPDQVDVAAEVMRRTGGRGADVALEAVGIAPTVQTGRRLPAKRGPTHAGRPLGGEGRIADADHRHPRVDRQQFVHFLRRVSGVPRPDGTRRDRRGAVDQRRRPVGRRAGVVRAAARRQRGAASR